MKLYDIANIREELQAVTQADFTWRVGNGAITQIVLATDGMGMSGNYDRIHIIADDNNIVVTLPAHNCDGWEMRYEN